MVCFIDFAKRTSLNSKRHKTTTDNLQRCIGVILHHAEASLPWAGSVRTTKITSGKLQSLQSVMQIFASEG